ncbi:MAG: hypothetical protein MRY78_10025 [Saprospiraceae bacterium]|nr:hypothetical protein [Saprospiraceae bacterium]
MYYLLPTGSIIYAEKPPMGGYIDCASTRKELENPNVPKDPNDARKRQISFLKSSLTPKGERYLKKRDQWRDMDIDKY